MPNEHELSRLNKPSRIVHQTAGGWANGARQEVAEVYAPTAEQCDAAVAFYRSVTRAGMTTEERINRAIALERDFDAEARHHFEDA